MALASGPVLGQVERPAPAVSSQPAAVRSDQSLEKAIHERFAKSKIAGDDFSVRVRDGVAVLEGRTDVAQHKGVATRLAKVDGVRKVDNRIELSEQARQKIRRQDTSRPRRVFVRRTEINR